jgi:hypothetical protein
MALPPGGLQIEDVESGGEAVSRLDRDPVGCTVKRHCDSERATLIRVDGEPDRVSGEPEPVGVDRRMAALDWICREPASAAWARTRRLDLKRKSAAQERLSEP